MPKTESGLTIKQAAFVREYVETYNGTAASIAAGYAEAGARTTGARLLANPRIAAEVKRLEDAKAERNRVTADWVIAKLRAAADDCLRKDSKGKPIHASAGVKALELLGKTRGCFTDRVEHSGIDGGPIVVESDVRDLSTDRLRELMAEAAPVNRVTDLAAMAAGGNGNGNGKARTNG